MIEIILALITLLGIFLRNKYLLLIAAIVFFFFAFQTIAIPTMLKIIIIFILFIWVIKTGKK